MGAKGWGVGGGCKRLVNFQVDSYATSHDEVDESLEASAGQCGGRGWRVGGSDSSFTVKFHRDETHGMPAFPPASACLLSMCVETGQRERWCVCRGAPTIKRGREDKHSNICSLLHSALRFWRGRAVLGGVGGHISPHLLCLQQGVW